MVQLSKHKPSKVRTTTTTVLFPVDLIDQIDAHARKWAVDNNLPPNRSRNKWIVSLLTEAINEERDPSLELSTEDLARMIHDASANIDPGDQSLIWENCTREYRNDLMSVADYIRNICKVIYRKKEEEEKD